MSEISDMIQRLCPDGVEYRKLGEDVNCLFPFRSPQGISHAVRAFSLLLAGGALAKQ